MTIWKYPLPSRGDITLQLPKNAHVLTVQNQGDQLVLWVIVEDRAATVPRHFSVRLTGHGGTFANTNYIGTVQFAGGAYVAHVFEVFP